MVPWYSLGMMYRGDMALPATSPLVFKLYENTNETIPDSLLAIMPTEEGKNAVPQLYEGLLRLIGAMVEIEDTMPQDAFGAVQVGHSTPLSLIHHVISRRGILTCPSQSRTHGP